MLKNSEIHLRDPFVVPVTEEKRYYLYGTRGPECWTTSATGLDYFTSNDLQNWEGPFLAFRPSSDFWSDRNFWAPEVHFYRGRYYMFVTFKAEDIHRGTQILAADGLIGPFLPISDGPVTPHDWECLDGTLYIDAEDQPWLVFCHEWVQVGDGEVCAIRLSEDLTATIGEPQILFRASEAPWTLAIDRKERKGYVTDGPFMHRLPNGDLIMLWSSFGASGYTVGVTRSQSGSILGPWQHHLEPLYTGDGGHCMVFRDFDGQLLLSYHAPNSSPDERPYFRVLEESATSLQII